MTPGKVVKSAAASALDLLPTILSMVGIDISDYAFDGIDRSRDLYSPEKSVLYETSLAFSAAPYEGT